MQRLSDLGPFGDLEVSEWVGQPPFESLADVRGHVVVIECFQMLCPGCVSHGLPQASRVWQQFRDDVVVVGLHTVFEHHDAMTPTALRAFCHEYRIPFPVGVDTPRGVGLPATMSRLALQGTPTLLLIDKQGNLRLNAFGQVGDLGLGMAITSLVLERDE